MGAIGAKVSKASLEELGRALSEIYVPVSLSDDPRYKWSQISADVGILAEDIRRGAKRRQKAQKRTLKILTRLLEFSMRFAGPIPCRDAFGAFLNNLMKRPSYTPYLGNSGLPEGPSRWIYAKYPLACAKCGEKPCHCILQPWIFEDRRERLEPYAAFVKKSHAERRSLPSRTLSQLTLPQVLGFFAGIYRNGYYNADVWKTVLHLSEEVTEASSELDRIFLAFSVQAIHSDPAIAVKVVDGVNRKLESELASDATICEAAKQRVRGLQIESRKPSDVLQEIALEKLKEEIADVFSWLAAVLYQLLDQDQTCDPADEAGVAQYFEDRFRIDDGQGVLIAIDLPNQGTDLICAWCRQHQCSDRCLVTNSMQHAVFDVASAV